jgi:hypothetical protein
MSKRLQLLTAALFSYHAAAMLMNSASQSDVKETLGVFSPFESLDGGNKAVAHVSAEHLGSDDAPSAGALSSVSLPVSPAALPQIGSSISDATGPSSAVANKGGSTGGVAEVVANLAEVTASLAMLSTPEAATVATAATAPAQAAGVVSKAAVGAQPMKQLSSARNPQGCLAEDPSLLQKTDEEQHPGKAVVKNDFLDKIAGYLEVGSSEPAPAAPAAPAPAPAPAAARVEVSVSALPGTMPAAAAAAAPPAAEAASSAAVAATAPLTAAAAPAAVAAVQTLSAAPPAVDPNPVSDQSLVMKPTLQPDATVPATTPNADMASASPVDAGAATTKAAASVTSALPSDLHAAASTSSQAGLEAGGAASAEAVTIPSPKPGSLPAASGKVAAEPEGGMRKESAESGIDLALKEFKAETGMSFWTALFGFLFVWCCFCPIFCYCLRARCCK